jgi:PEP-CTERM motif
MRRLALWTPARRGVQTLLALAALSLPLALPANATTLTDGEFVTWSQGAWGGDPFCGPTVCNISGLLEKDFNSLFGPSDLLELGVPGAGGFSMIFDSADAIIAYLPASGTPGPLTADLLDPVTTASGVLGGEVLTAALNILFSDDGLLAHPRGVSFGDLVFQNLDLFSDTTEGPGVGPEITELDGMSVREAVSDANTLLGGGASSLTPEDLFELLNFTSRAFNGGEVEENANMFLALPSTAPTVPEPSTWAMLLIGFAGLGFAGWRASRSGKNVTGREMRG